MRILVMSKEGDGCGLAYQLHREGHGVDLWIKDNRYRDTLRGIVPRVAEWRPNLPKADLVVCDSVGWSPQEPLFRRLGKPVLSCNPLGDAIELDRIKGFELMQALDMATPPSQRFGSVKEAKALEWKHDLGYVVKPCGNIDPGQTFVCRTREIYDWALGTYKTEQEMLVQEIVEGIEISTEGWFNGRDWISPFNHTFEEKRFMPGDQSPMTGCMGNVVFTSSGDRLCEDTLGRMTNSLRLVGYRGPLDINCIVTKDKAYALEFTSRFGYDAIEALTQGLREPLADLLFETALGVKKQMDVSDDFLMSVRVTQPPYPDDNAEQSKFYKHSPVTGLTDIDSKHVFPCDLQSVDGMLQCAGADGLLLKACSHGRTVSEAKKRAYKIVSNVRAIDLQVRQDIGDRVPGDIERLKQWGWLN